MQSWGQKECESSLDRNQAEYPPRLGWEDAGGPVKEQGLFSEVASQRDANKAGKQLAQEDHFHFPDTSPQLKLTSEEN